MADDPPSAAAPEPRRVASLASENSQGNAHTRRSTSVRAAVPAASKRRSVRVDTAAGTNGAHPPSSPSRKSRGTPRASTDATSLISPGGMTGSTPVGVGNVVNKDETGDVLSSAVVPPGAAFVSDSVHGTPRRPRSHRLLGTGGTNSKRQSYIDDDDTNNNLTSNGTSSGEAGKRTSRLDTSGLHAGLQDLADERERAEAEPQEESDEEEYLEEEVDEDYVEEQRIIAQGGTGLRKDEHGVPVPILGPLLPTDKGKKCIVLDLDETLVHSSFKLIPDSDFVVPVEIEGVMHNVYVAKRPGVDEFLRVMGTLYEVVVFTASLSKYADPVLDILDKKHRVVRHRLFRESCHNHKGNFVKDLSQLGRPLKSTIIIDNSPASYLFHPYNAVPISSWFNDAHDTELRDLCPFLHDLAVVDDVRAVLDGRIHAA